MNSVYCNTLQVLLKFLDLTFSKSASDRRRLHDIEWESGDTGSSVLGEVEVRADAVIGVVRTYLKKNSGNIDDMIEALQASSIYESESIVLWISSDGDSFSDFLCYIEAIESLRICMITFLKKESSSS